jgi:hypothetical protein
VDGCYIFAAPINGMQQDQVRERNISILTHTEEAATTELKKISNFGFFFDL